MSLPERPPFHATTLIFAVDAILIILSAVFKSQTPTLFSMIFTVAWLSHHVRDAVRRGLWFYPYGSTPPLQQGVYMGIVTILPLVMRLGYKKLEIRDIISEKLTSVDIL